MASTDYVKPTADGCLLFIDASPGASKTEIVGINKWRGAVHVKISAVAKEGAANEELLRFLSSKLGVPARSLSITRGARSSRKTVHVMLDARKVRELMERG